VGAVQVFIVGYIVYYYPQEVVEPAGHQMATHDLGSSSYRCFESIKGVFVLARQGDFYKHVGA
jgi:hypothetical protein